MTEFTTISDSRSLVLKTIVDDFTINFTYSFTANPAKAPYSINFNAMEYKPENQGHTGNTVVTGSYQGESNRFQFETFSDSDEAVTLPIQIKKICKELYENYDR
ncbi:hypothetical protein [Elizabethkingia phage TCUEAP1]|nr:hypothetical protein [Elizabethkingia phage TCUEAP1]